MTCGQVSVLADVDKQSTTANLGCTAVATVQSWLSYLPQAEQADATTTLDQLEEAVTGDTSPPSARLIRLTDSCDAWKGDHDALEAGFISGMIIASIVTFVCLPCSMLAYQKKLMDMRWPYSYPAS